MLHVLASGMTIDELARQTGTTTRNVRALQTAGVLLKPEIVGRTAHYDEAHAKRLIAVLRLQRDGFSIASIRALLEAMTKGRSLSDVLGLACGGSAQDSVDKFRAGPSPDPFGDQPEGDEPDLGDSPRSEGGSPRIRLLSDLPTTVLDIAI